MPQLRCVRRWQQLMRNPPNLDPDSRAPLTSQSPCIAVQPYSLAKIIGSSCNLGHLLVVGGALIALALLPLT